ncbi:hypothetical protein [Planctomycetes bacterium K23_9]|uniref:Uncharacterized protein n=1 Tax=Stieleria marina TaxID=1930275 RepID=A0A517P1E3_9BACT|nr:hypothetical protein K239x_52070 [Planctomycetes bacterium K23_9]
MLTIAQLTTEPTNEVSEAAIVTPMETLPSDAEISSRVLNIRSRWSVEERIARRREADSRFADLLCALIDADTAA